MELTIDELRMLARRCRLSLTEEELEKYRGDLDALEALSAALLPFEESTAQPRRVHGLEDLRKDVTVEPCDRELLLSQAPVRDGAYLSVPCAVEGAT